MFLLTISATVTSLVVEAIKKTFKVKSFNIVALCVSLVIGVAVPCGYMILFGKYPMTAQDAVYVIAMALLTWLCSTLGFDKVKQTLLQLRG